MPPSFYMVCMWQGGDVKYSSGFPIVFRLPIMSWTPGNRLVTPSWSRIPNCCKCKASFHSSSYRKLAFLYFLACERDLRELYYLLRRGIAMHTKISHTCVFIFLQFFHHGEDQLADCDMLPCATWATACHVVWATPWAMLAS
ncbi:unnamed protein product [Prunus armeniaca]